MRHPIEIRSPEIDTDVIMTRIRENLCRRKLDGYLAPDLPEFQVPTMPRVADVTLQYHLDRANAIYDKTWINLSIKPSIFTKIPVIGRLWRLIRENMHRLILYYAEMAISRQIGFNAYVVGALNRLASAQEEIVLLRSQVDALHDEVDALNQELAGRQK